MSLNVRMEFNERDLRQWEEALRRVDVGNRDVAEKVVFPSLLEVAFEAQTLTTRKYMGNPPQGSPDRTGPGTLGIRTGRLRRSIAVDQGRRPYRVDVGTNVEYAAPHEFGGRRLPARPYLGPGATEAGKNLPKILLKRWSAYVADARRSR